MNEAPLSYLEHAIAESGLFTRVEPRWLATSNHQQTWVNRSRGVVLITQPYKQGSNATAHTFSDSGKDTYNSHGCYDADELTRWWFPVMESDRAWEHHAKHDGENGYDITIAAEKV